MTAYDITRSHPNNPFRQPTYHAPEDIYTDPAYPMHGSKWLGFGPGPTKVDTQVVHYPGSRLSDLQMSTKTEDVRGRLRSSNESSWKNRGYALYYNFDLPTDGSLYGIRAFNWRNAANADDDKSDGNENDWSFAVHTILQKVNSDPQSNVTVEPTWNQLETLRWLRWEAREYAIEATGNASFDLKLLPHQAIKPTGCPGDKMAAAIAAGALNIPDRNAVRPDPDPEDNMAKRTLFIPTDADAQFLGWGDEGGNAIEVTWVTKEVADAHRAVGVVIRDALSAGGFRNCVLLGPLPTGDTRKQWIETDFFRVVS